MQLPGQIFIRDRNAGLITYDLLGREGKGVALPESDLAVAEGADAVFRALGVQHDGHGKTQTIADTLNGVHHFFMLLVSAVGEVEACNVHARLHHTFKYSFVLAGGADRADNFCFFHIYLPLGR